MKIKKSFNKFLKKKRFQSGGLTSQQLTAGSSLVGSAADAIPADSNGLQSEGAATLSGAAKGAAMGSSILPGWGTVIGGVIGGASGYFKSHAAHGKMATAMDRKRQLDVSKQIQDSSAILANYDNMGTGIKSLKEGGILISYPGGYQVDPLKFTPSKYTFKQGGRMPLQAGNGTLQPIDENSNAYEVKGHQPGATDDVQVGDAFVDHNEVVKPSAEGMRIFSDTLKPPGSKEAFSKHAKKLEKQKTKEDTKFPLQNQRIEKKLDDLFQLQQQMNGDNDGESPEEAMQPSGEVPGQGMDQGNMFKTGGFRNLNDLLHVNPIPYVGERPIKNNPLFTAGETYAGYPKLPKTFKQGGEELFVYGTLKNPKTMEKALGEHSLKKEIPQTLQGEHKVGHNYATEEQGGNTKGDMYKITPSELTKLDKYEADYDRVEVKPGEFMYKRKSNYNDNGKKRFQEGGLKISYSGTSAGRPYHDITPEATKQWIPNGFGSAVMGETSGSQSGKYIYEEHAPHEIAGRYQTGGIAGLGKVGQLYNDPTKGPYPIESWKSQGLNTADTLQRGTMYQLPYSADRKLYGALPPAGANPSDITRRIVPQGGESPLQKILQSKNAVDFKTIYGEQTTHEKMGFKSGGIHIKPSHKGRFTAYKARTGKTTEQALHSSDPHVRQMANFAKNAKKWHHHQAGGVIPSDEEQVYREPETVSTSSPVSTEKPSKMKFNWKDGLGTAAALAPIGVNLMAADQLPQVAQPYLTNPVQFKKINAADQVNAAQQGLRTGFLASRLNSANPNVQRGTAGEAQAGYLNNLNSIYGNVNRENAGISNQEAMFNTGINARNNQLLTERNQAEVARQANMLGLKSQSRAALSNVLQGSIAQENVKGLDKEKYSMYLNFLKTQGLDPESASRQGYLNWLDKHKKKGGVLKFTMANC